MKKFVLIFMILSIMFSTLPTTIALASGEVTPYYVGIRETRRSLSISGGEAVCYSSVSTRNVDYKISYMMHLQRMDSTWVNVASWTVSGTYRVSREESKEVESGKYYRVKIIGHIYDADWNLIESFEEVSSTQKCP